MTQQVTFNWAKPIPLLPNEIVQNGVAFDCNQCTDTAGICCNAQLTNPASIVNQCFQCACQQRGNNECGIKGQNNNACTDPASEFGCLELNYNVNGSLFAPSQTTTMTCVDAVPILSTPGNNLSLTAVQQILVQCAPAFQLRCCQNDSVLGPTVCGEYWGNVNFHIFFI
jgi:hypothetical protein